MSQELQQVLNGLRETMAEAIAKDFQPQVLDWLRSNCNLIPLDGQEHQALQQELLQVKQELEETKQRYTKPIPRSGRPHPQSNEVQMGVDEEGNPVQLTGEAIQDPNQTDVFMDRAALMNPGIRQNQNRQQELQQMVKQIKRTGVPAATGSVQAAPVITPEMIASASPEQIEAMEAALNPGYSDPYATTSAPYDDGSEPLPPIAEALARMGNQGPAAQGGYNAKDVAMLQRLQGKAQQARSTLDRGGSVGLIRR
jgi:hypothetical protein